MFVKIKTKLTWDLRKYWTEVQVGEDPTERRAGDPPAGYEAVLQAPVISFILRQANRPDMPACILTIYSAPQLEFCGNMVHCYIVTVNWTSLSDSLLNI